MRFTLILTLLLGCAKHQLPFTAADTVRLQFNPDGKIPCRSSLNDNTLDSSGFCLSSVSQEFRRGVSVEIVTYEQAAKALELERPFPWSRPRSVGKVDFAYGSHRSINRMSAMKIRGTWWYMWGESRWFTQSDPDNNGQTCAMVEVIEQGVLLFCSKDKELLDTEIKTLRALIERVAGSKM